MNSWQVLYDQSNQIRLLADDLHALIGHSGSVCDQCIQTVTIFMKDYPEEAVTRLGELGYAPFV
jgi:hypothetical protein